MIPHDALIYINEQYYLSTDIKTQFIAEHSQDLVELSSLMAETIKNGGKILACGNGGSAADSQHFTSELVGRISKDRPPRPALALTTDTSAITAVGNDYGFDDIFSRQVEALGKKGDLLFAFSTSGMSANVLKAVLKAKSMGLITIGLTGGSGGELKTAVDYCMVVSATSITSRIQELHGFAIHMLVEVADLFLEGK